MLWCQTCASKSLNGLKRIQYAKSAKILETRALNWTVGKQTTEFVLSEESWSDVIAVLQSGLSAFLARYQANVKFLAGSDHKDLRAEPLRINNYDPGGQFHWHINDNSAQNQNLAVQWYFNSVNNGGHTELEDQETRIKPMSGRIAFFPVGWTNRHRGVPPSSGPKYVCTTFVHRIF